MVQKWHYIDGKLEALPRKVPGLYLERDGYYRFPTTSTKWFAEIPHLRREDDQAFFVVIKAAPEFRAPDGMHASSEIFFFDDKFCLKISWNETTGVEDPRHAHQYTLYGFRRAEISDTSRLLQYRKTAAAESYYGEPVNGFLPSNVFSKVRNAILEGWCEWPTPGMRRLPVEHVAFSGQKHMSWASVPHVLSYDGRPGEWHQRDGVTIRDDVIAGPRSYLAAISSRDWIVSP